MAGPQSVAFDSDVGLGLIRIKSFAVERLFGGASHLITFPETDALAPGPGILVLTGENGSGKTTVLRMIHGILQLDFDLFRRTPFTQAKLILSNGDAITVKRASDPDFPIRVSFREIEVELYKTKDASKLSDDQNQRREVLRKQALPILQTINYELLDIHRTMALWNNRADRAEAAVNVASIPEFREVRTADGRTIIRRLTPHGEADKALLASRVKTFVRDAQVNYRRFFSADELSLLPRILERFRSAEQMPDRSQLLARLIAVQSRYPLMKRFGLQTDDADLNALVDLLRDEAYQETHSLTLLETYVEMQESQNKARELIAERLESFETIMAEFLIAKPIRIDAREGLIIQTQDGSIEETDLSSGEYHFLYMMVTALLCHRSGSIIAIDEPELSLHVTWQRKIINALALCAARASPLFIFATHSAAIASEHADRIYSLSSIEQ